MFILLFTMHNNHICQFSLKSIIEKTIGTITNVTYMFVCACIYTQSLCSTNLNIEF